MTSGFFKLGTWRNVPLFFHWTLLLWVPFYWSRFGSLFWAVVTFAAYTALVLIHEMGHALVANWRGLPVFAMRLHVLGGECEHAAAGREKDSVWVAWGGVLAQLCVLVAALAAKYATAGLHVQSELLEALFFVFINANLFTIAFNLIPVAPLDGYRAWRAIPLLWAKLRPGNGQMPGSLTTVLIAKKRKTAPVDAKDLAAGFRDKVRKRD